jgi:hypothetical protein
MDNIKPQAEICSPFESFVQISDIISDLVVYQCSVSLPCSRNREIMLPASQKRGSEILCCSRLDQNEVNGSHGIFNFRRLHDQSSCAGVKTTEKDSGDINCMTYAPGTWCQGSMCLKFQEVVIPFCAHAANSPDRANPFLSPAAPSISQACGYRF